MKKSSVPMPEKNTATLGSNPMRIGATMVEPDMASRCWMPIGTEAAPGSLSSGITTAPVVLRHLGKYDISLSSEASRWARP